jgi:hypothetical protein
MTRWGESTGNLPASEELPFPIFLGRKQGAFFKLHAKGRCRGETAFPRHAFDRIVRAGEKLARHLDAAADQRLVRRKSEALLEPVVQMRHRPARAPGQFRQPQRLGITPIHDLKHLLQFHGQAALSLDAQVEFGLKMEAAEDVAQQDLGIKTVVGMETHHLMGEEPHLVKLLPSRDAGDPAPGMLAVPKSHRQTAIGITEIAAPDGAVAGQMPKKVSRTQFLPFSVDLHTAPAGRDELHALLPFFKSNRSGMTSGTLMIMRYRKQLSRFFRP